MLAAAAAVVTVLALSVAGCLDRGAEPAGGPPPLIDENAGAYRGVRMGMSEAEVRRVLGEPGAAGRDEGFFPVGTTHGEIGGAPAVRVWPPDDRTAPVVLRYADAAFLVGSRGVFAFVVTAPRARTRGDVRIGDRLRTARRRYRLGCGEGVGGERIGGGVAYRYPTCRGTVEGDLTLRIWFGEDPIRSITLARVGGG